VPRERSDRPFVEELPRLLSEREMSLRALSREVGVTDAHLSRVLRRVGYKTPSPDLARRVAVALDLPQDYFPEYREGFVIERIKADPVERDRLYERLRKGRPQRARGKRR
jgi:transcriptional regulator with XRE-family HTH domain